MMMKALKKIFFQACLFLYANLNFIFILSCAIIGNGVGWMIRQSIIPTVYLAIVFGIFGALIGFMLLGVFEFIVSKFKNDAKVVLKEKTKKVVPVQNEIIKKPDIDCGPACKDCDINKGRFTTEDSTFYCIFCNGGREPPPLEREGED